MDYYKVLSTKKTSAQARGFLLYIF